MAKISARGDRERLRWRHRDGSLLVLTEQGRLLRKAGWDTTYRVVAPTARGDKKWTEATAGAQAAMWRYERAASRA